MRHSASPPPGLLFQFALDPEEEARQVAQRAVADGRMRGLVLLPNNEWGQRVFRAFDSEIKPEISGGKGIVVFEKLLTGYSGTGHTDLFDGESLSDAPRWYPCQRLKIWYVVVP